MSSPHGCRTMLADLSERTGPGLWAMVRTEWEGPRAAPRAGGVWAYRTAPIGRRVPYRARRPAGD